MNSLGERIKQLRKQKKMTLAELAGDRLTKGMLSLIENGKAQPSMESLRYIAERVGVEVSALLDDGNIEELRELLLEIETLFKSVYYLHQIKENEKVDAIYKKLSAKKSDLTGKTYEEIRLLDFYIRLSAFLNYEQEEVTMFDVITYYEKIHAYSRIIDCYSFLAGDAFQQNDYNIALEFVLEAEQRIEPYKHLIDHIALLDLHYLLTVLYAAIDNTAKTQEHLNLALEIAHKNRIYYRLDDFYRFTFIQAIGQADEVKSKYYLTKLTQHAEFTEDKVAISGLAFAYGHYTNLIEKDYKKVPSFSKYIITKRYGPDDVEDAPILYQMEETYSYWAIGNYQKALETSQSITIPDYIHHPVDLSIMYRCFAVRALCFYELGDKEAAKSEILFAYHGVAEFPNSIYKKFIQEAYEKIRYGKRGK
ncbi:helix-turn-helix domain-containing protein [Ureibacillus chungkukjangi]|uniref:Xre family transcriptional regulator /transcriptional regulator n=1 Tax=Ureibacillus chungkukjangi TaxID=1202712 RepID=A0A318TR97_9BACL|nr:helix-turn-helix domain-containing protein [Ureibacillus chungkukjangi]MCM3388377.1 helix-turn-helix domain-containing protein [Ureibacillus chungkukjangi]PYF07376.1 Xre family transcriptional regulator /transcriptional regulator [Ureibacillus chungkukjangi]